MSARAGGVLALLRQVFPESRLSLPGLGLCLLLVALLAAMGRIADDDVPQAYLLGGAWVAALWWLLLGGRLCALAYQMAALRLPRVPRLLWRGALVHGAGSTLLPLAVLAGFAPAGVDGLTLLAALCLGSALGLLAMSMPMVAPLVPLLLVVGDFAMVANPLACGLLAGLALCLSALAWRWQLSRMREAHFAPLGVALSGSELSLTNLLRPVASQPQRAAGCDTGAAASAAAALAGTAPRTRARDLLAALLGPVCQTTRQLYGRKGQALTYLVFAGVGAAALAWGLFWPPERERGILLALMIAAAPFLALKPAIRLAQLRQDRGAGLAELQLTPGMPAVAQLPRAIMRQMLYCLGERFLLLGWIMPAIALPAYGLNAPWLLHWLGMLFAGLLFGLAWVWLAWQAQGRRWTWWALAFVGLALAMATNVRSLVHARALDSGWALAWAAWALLVVVFFHGLRRQSCLEDNRLCCRCR